MGTQRQEYGTIRTVRCVDADQQDVNTLHPSEVRQWNCYDASTDDYTLEDYVTATCGCSTPQPSLAPPPSPEPEPTSICPSGESFLVDTVVTQEGASLAGCFEDTGGTNLGIPV